MVVLALCAFVAAGHPVPSVMFLPLQLRGGVTADLADQVSTALVLEAARHAEWRVVGFKEVEGALSQDQLRQVAGCDAIACAAEIAGALDTDEVVMGTLGLIGDEYFLTASRVRARDGQVVARAAARVASGQPTALLDQAGGVVAALLGVTPNAAPMAATPRPAPAVAAPTQGPWWRPQARWGGTGACVAALVLGSVGVVLWTAVGIMTVFDVSQGDWKDPRKRHHAISWQVAAASDTAVVFGALALLGTVLLGAAGMAALVAAGLAS